MSDLIAGFCFSEPFSSLVAFYRHDLEERTVMSTAALLFSEPRLSLLLFTTCFCAQDGGGNHHGILPWNSLILYCHYRLT